MSTTTELKQQLAELRKLAEAVTQWSNCNQAWLDTAEDVPAATVGHINEDGEKYPVAVIDCDQYYAAQDSIKLARFYASANPAAILSLVNRIAELEAELAGRTAAHGEPSKCPTCQGNDADMPCAYPSEGMSGCLRDKRQAGSAEQVSEREANRIIEGLLKLHDSKKPAGSIHGQIVGLEPYVVRANGNDLSVLLDAAELIHALQHTAPAPSKAGEWTDERIVKAVRDAFATDRIALTFVNHEGIEKPTYVAKSFVRALSSAPAQAGAENAETQPKTRMDAVSAGGPKAAQAHSEDAMDAARYRHLVEEAISTKTNCSIDPDEVVLVVPADWGDDWRERTAKHLDAAMSTPSEKENSNG